MFFPTITLTNAGKALIVKGLAGAVINFSKVALGNGDAPEDAREATDLTNLIANLEITQIERGDGCVVLTATFDNGDLESGFYGKELGIFADDPDDGEILYAYSNAGDQAAYIPGHETDSYEQVTFKIVVAVGDAENVTATIGEYGGYATKVEFDAHLDDAGNPHGVTADQVGLGNVPNVSTNNQAPTYSIASDNEELSSGETLSVAFGKLARIVRSFISHLTASNPHGITAAGIGAASSVHTHSASDITKGSLSIARGGTGAATQTGALQSLGANPRVSIIANTGDEKSVPDGRWTALHAGTIQLTSGHRYMVSYLVNFVPSESGYRQAKLQLDGVDVGIISQDQQRGSSISSFLGRTVMLYIQPGSNKNLSIVGYQNSGGNLNTTLRYQITDFGA